MDWQEKYFHKAILSAKILRKSPFIRFVGLNGSLAVGTASPESDIDFLIIAAENRLYTVRFWATILLGLHGWRRRGRKIAGRICLNCYLATENLSIRPENKSSEAKVIKAYGCIIPLVDAGGIAEKFKKQNDWIFKKPLQYPKQPLEIKNFSPMQPTNFGEKVLSGKFGDYLENKMKKYQTRRILAGVKEGDEIFLTDFAIKLHPKKDYSSD